MSKSSQATGDVADQRPIQPSLLNGLKRSVLAAQLLLTFAQRLWFIKRTRYSLSKAKTQKNTRWVHILQQEGWNLYLLMHPRAVPRQNEKEKHLKTTQENFPNS